MPDVTTLAANVKTLEDRVADTESAITRAQEDVCRCREEFDAAFAEGEGETDAHDRLKAAEDEHERLVRGRPALESRLRQARQALDSAIAQAGAERLREMVEERRSLNEDLDKTMARLSDLLRRHIALGQEMEFVGTKANARRPIIQAPVNHLPSAARLGGWIRGNLNAIDLRLAKSNSALPVDLVASEEPVLVGFE